MTTWNGRIGKMNNINFLEELEPYLHKFENQKQVDGKFMSCSPFRDEKHPSFVLFLDKGNWVDSGTGQKGYFTELLAYLSGDDVESIQNHLKEKYQGIVDPDELKLALTFDLNSYSNNNICAFMVLSQYQFRHPYLNQRGVSENVQKGFRIGYDKDTNSVVIPWTDKKGSIVRLMFRAVQGKRFWYGKEGDRIKNHLFGLYHVHRKQSKTVWIVEAPIDCMYLWSQGIPSVATGTASISWEQLKLLKQSPTEELIIASDNDFAGRKFKNQLIDNLGGVFTLKYLEFPDGCKDVNDMSPKQVANAQIKPVNMFTNFL